MKVKDLNMKIKERIANHFNVDIECVTIGDYEHRGNDKGYNLESGQPVYVLMNTGVEKNEEVNEFFGWVINGRWFKENC